ncbi:glycosyltransferase family 2 protein [Pseudaestuariivita rosea]|uniref:glycosyltransferase family 2 protein n=1 Tax=Pseudaestuariivita rosea TaxID=2763263 RepID=UPI001ABAC786|nr:glycosyltransferase family 2 protein [Pseudaestuariivita rosea]
MAKVLISSLRNEGPYILEWVAYHRAIGFDQIIVAYNDCDDGSAEMLEALQGIGWLIAVPNVVDQGVAPQQSAAHIIKSSGKLKDGDWVIWIDLDEFVNVHIGERRIDDLIAHIEPAWGMLIPWRLFGDGNGAEFKGRFVSQDFTLAASPKTEMTWAIKTLFRYGPEISRLDIHRPYLNEGNGLDFEDVIGGKGGPLSRRWGPNHRWLSGIAPRSFPRIGREDKGWDLAQINHYAVRTREMYQLKRLRGRGYWTEAKTSTKLRHTGNLFNKLNTNEETDNSILHWQDRTTHLMGMALQDDAVERAQKLIADRLTENLSLLEQDTIEQEQTTVEPVPIPLPEMHFRPQAVEMIKQAYSQAEVILEYGSGGSTVFAAQETSATVLSIESDRDWADKLIKGLEAHGFMRDGVEVRHIDIGPTRAWGKPKSTAHWNQFCNYPLEPWNDMSFSPDLVLIDGRFRMGCFAATLMNCRQPLTVMWDDYVNRPRYHEVQEVLEPCKTIGRIALFDVAPQTYSPDQLNKMVRWFFNTG